MSQIDAEENVLSQTGADEGENVKYVPVSESIRYRKRAQGAEKMNEELSKKLAEAELQNEELVKQVSRMKMEEQLTSKLVAAGAVDVEAAMLIAKARIEGAEKADVDGCIEQLKKEKRYLFGGLDGVSSAGRKTAGVKERADGGKTALETAAKKAVQSGSRADVQEYLKLRRNFV